MEHLPSGLQLASFGGVAALAALPADGAHLTFYGVLFAGICSIVTTVINRRADRKRDLERYAHDKEVRAFQAEQVKAAFAVANAPRGVMQVAAQKENPT